MQLSIEMRQFQTKLFLWGEFEVMALLGKTRCLSELTFIYSIITLEDVLEALLQEEIYDEADAEGRINCTREEQVEVDDEDGFFYEIMT